MELDASAAEDSALDGRDGFRRDGGDRPGGHHRPLEPGEGFEVRIKSPLLAVVERGLHLGEQAAELFGTGVVGLERGGGSVEDLLNLLSVIAPKIKRRAPERAYWGAEKKAERDSRFTPPDFMQPIYRVFGPVSTDPCAHIASPVIAARRFFLEQGDDGLVDPWSGRLAFVNPPYSGTLDWLRRAYEEWAAGHVETIICLVPVRIDSPFFQDVVKPNADIYFLRNRLKFGRVGGKPQQTPHSLMLVIFGATSQQKARFASLVRGFWASATDNQSVSVSGTAAASMSFPRRSDRRFTTSTCAAPGRVGDQPVRVCCGPVIQRRGEAR